MGKAMRMVFIFMVVTFLSLFLTSAIQSQELSPEMKQKGGRIYFLYGDKTVDIKSLNSTLESKGYPTFSNNFIFSGLGGYGITGKLVIGGEVKSYKLRSSQNGNRITSVYGHSGSFDLGYILYSRDRLKIFPLFGLGIEDMVLMIDEQSKVTFNEVLENPKWRATLSNSGFLLNLAIGTEYLFKNGVLLGLRAGYSFSSLKNSWYMNGLEVLDGPSVGVSGPYVQLMLGFGWNKK